MPFDALLLALALEMTLRRVVRAPGSPAWAATGSAPGAVI